MFSFLVVGFLDLLDRVVAANAQLQTEAIFSTSDYSGLIVHLISVYKVIFVISVLLSDFFV